MHMPLCGSNNFSVELQFRLGISSLLFLCFGQTGYLLRVFFLSYSRKSSKAYSLGHRHIHYGGEERLKHCVLRSKSLI